jgi:uncharacterized integral membrane protein
MKSREWVSVTGGFVIVVGILVSVTIAVFVTHPCGRLGMDEFAQCGAVVPAGIVAAVSLLVGVPLLWIGGRSRGLQTRSNRDTSQKELRHE